VCDKIRSGNVQDSIQTTKSSRSSFVKSIKDTFHPAGGNYSYGSVRGSSLGQQKQRRDAARIPAYIFAKNVPPPVADFKLPEPDERFNNTPQLVCCLSLLQDTRSPDEYWIQLRVSGYKH